MRASRAAAAGIGAPQETGEARRKRRVALGLGLKLAVSAGLLAWILRQIGLDTLLAVMATAAPARLAAAALLLVVSHFLGSWQWGRLLAAAGLDLPWGRIAVYYFAGACGNLVLPTGAGGDLARIVGAGREGGRRGAAAGATLVDRLLGLGVLGAIGLAAILGSRELAATPTGRLALLLAAVNAGLSLAALAVVLSPASGRVLAFAGRLLPSRFRGRLDRLEAALGRVRAARGRGPLLLVALLVQVTRILAHAQVARALDLDLGLRYFFLFVPLLAVAVAMPISIGGIGVRESMGAVLFGLLGVAAAEASAMQLLAYVVAVAVSAPGAVVLIGTGARRESAPLSPERPPGRGEEPK
jgi:hypothetical protein